MINAIFQDIPINFIAANNGDWKNNSVLPLLVSSSSVVSLKIR